LTKMVLKNLETTEGLKVNSIKQFHIILKLL